MRKIQFLHVSTTFVAPELDSLAQIENLTFLGFFIFHRPLLPLYRGWGFEIHAQLQKRDRDEHLKVQGLGVITLNIHGRTRFDMTNLMQN